MLFSFGDELKKNELFYIRCNRNDEIVIFPHVLKTFTINGQNLARFKILLLSDASNSYH